MPERYQIAGVNASESDYLPVICGVLQGSILGPLLFVLYINSLPSVIKYPKIFLCADDTAIVCKGNSKLDMMMMVS